MKTPLRSLIVLLFCGILQLPADAYQTKEFAVRIRGTLNGNQILLEWDGDFQDQGATYKVSRLQGGVNGVPTWFEKQSSTQKSYVDTDITPGNIYEYQVEKVAWPQGYVPRGFGYISVGYNGRVNYLETKGKLILLVDSVYSAQLPTAINTLVEDLTGDGYRVIRHDINVSLMNPASVKALIQSEYNNDPVNVKTLFLLGHIPVPYSGDISPDGHADHRGAWAADAYYGDMNGSWTDSQTLQPDTRFDWNENMPGDGRWDQSHVPSTLEVQVGRVDFHELNSFPGKNNIQLMSQYLNKNHNYRHKGAGTQLSRRGFIADRNGDYNGWAPAALAWRGFVGAFGVVGAQGAWNYTGRITAVDTTLNYFTTLASADHVFSSAFSTSVDSAWPFDHVDVMGYSSDFSTYDIKTVFGTISGSYIGDWNTQNNFLRSFLGSASHTLAVAWAGKPHWYFHHMSSGSPIGVSTRATQNNGLSGLYKTYIQGGDTGGKDTAGMVHIALHGDPTLRLHVVKPPPGVVTATPSGSSVTVSWTPVTGETAVQGYHVYRAFNKYGSYKRVTTTPVNSPWTEINVPKGFHTYMVRTVKLEGVTASENMASGTYHNLSQGAFSSIVDVPNGAPWVLTVLDFGSEFTAAYSINNRVDHEIVGSVGINSRARRWYGPAQYTDYNGYWGTSDKSWGFGVNGLEVMTGTLDNMGQGTTLRAYRLPHNTGLATILNPLPTANISEGAAINSSGTVAGFGKNSSGVFRAIRWNGQGPDVLNANDLEALSTGSSRISYAYGINTAGYIVGKAQKDVTGAGNVYFHAFMALPEKKISEGGIDLGTLGAAANNSDATAINDFNAVTGASQEGTATYVAFYRSPAGTFTRITPFAGATGSSGYGINNYHAVVGHSGNQAFIWQPEMGLTARNLNSYDSSPSTLVSAEAINDQMVIVGRGTHYSTGNPMAFILSPP